MESNTEKSTALSLYREKYLPLPTKGKYFYYIIKDLGIIGKFYFRILFMVGSYLSSLSNRLHTTEYMIGQKIIISPAFPRKNLLILPLLCLFSYTIFGQNIVSGTVVDAESQEPLVGARILIQPVANGQALERLVGGMSQVDGSFQFDSPISPPFNLQVTYLGFDTLSFAVSSLNRPLKLRMDPTSLSLDEVEITASPLAEAQRRSPLTVESMSINAIKETPAANFYEGLGNLKGVDMNDASLGFKVVNTRGFNSTQPVRSLQLIDGVDNQSPGLNFSLGNFLGASELDLESVTLVVGASSAFYGPNAFNGVISMKTKSPFIHKGLSASIKVGERNLIETSLRYAKVFNNAQGEPKFAIKANIFYMQANDWEARNFDEAYRDTTELGTTPFVGEDNPGGYDAVNVYGDEVLFNASSTGNDRINLPGLKRYYRTGFKEEDLLDYDTDNVKASLSLHYKLNPQTELIASSNYSQGTTVFQGVNRISLRDIQFFQHKLEVKQEDRFFIRAYMTHEDAGNSYDPVFTAFRLQSLITNDLDWRTRYRNWWRLNATPQVKAIEGYPSDPMPPDFRFDFAQQENIFVQNQALLSSLHQQARADADIALLVPGTPGFQAAFDSITSRIIGVEGGTRFYDKSALYHIHGEYKFTPEFGTITLGGNARLYTPETRGSIFADTANREITNFEYGVYAGIQKPLNDENIILTGTLRMDKNENFDYLFSPAVTGLFNLNDQNSLRVSFSSAIRNPTLADQFLNYDVGGAVLLGNITGYENLVTLNSLGIFNTTLSQGDLEFFDLDRVEPEKVITAELGYRGFVGQRLYIDAGYYFSRYQDFIGFQFGFRGSFSFGLPLGRVFRISSNAEKAVTTQGAALGLNYFLTPNITLGGNYSWNVLNTETDDPIVPAYNTPEHKFNVSLSGRNVKLGAIRNLGFNINYKWVEGYLFEGSPQFTGLVPSYDRLDLQVNKKFPELKATVKVGASNSLNNKTFTVYGGPRIGRMIYASINFDFPNF